MVFMFHDGNPICDGEYLVIVFDDSGDTLTNCGDGIWIKGDDRLFDVVAFANYPDISYTIIKKTYEKL